LGLKTIAIEIKLKFLFKKAKFLNNQLLEFNSKAPISIPIAVGFNRRIWISPKKGLAQ
jgi:hypothetical protein